MNNHSKGRWVPAMAVLVLAAVVAPTPAYGQATTYARLLGTVTDQTGAVVPGVEVEATATATNVPRLAVTDDRGNYLIDKLIPGRYDLKAELPGFKPQISLDVRLEVTQVARVDFTMTPGEIAEQVTVTGQATIIDTDTAEVGAVIEERKILEGMEDPEGGDGINLSRTARRSREVKLEEAAGKPTTAGTRTGSEAGCGR